MRKTLRNLFVIVLSIIIFGGTAIAQLPAAIKLSPLNSDGKTSITITFDPSKACDNGAKTLVGETKIQMHSSAHTTNKPMTDWGNYGIDYNADPADEAHTTTDLTANGDGTFSISFVPADFYGVPADSTIIGLSIVFNNGSWDKEGKDVAASGCKDFKVSLTNPDASIVKTILANKRFSFSPNPAVDKLSIIATEQIRTVTISDILGKEVLKVSGNQKVDFDVNIKNLSKGVYIISVYDVTGFAGSSKLLKQ